MNNINHKEPNPAVKEPNWVDVGVVKEGNKSILIQAQIKLKN